MLVSRVEREIEGMRHDTYDLRRYIAELKGLLDTQTPHHEGGGGHKVVGSPAPWNEPAGALLLDIHAASRQCADALSRALGEPARPRGSTDAGTLIALDSCAVNAVRLHELDPRNELPSAVYRRLSTLAHRCRELLGCLRQGEEPWTKAPGDLTCPNLITSAGEIASKHECGAPLWLAPGWSREAEPPVYCRSGRPSCILEDGSPYSWPYGAWHRVVTGVLAEHRGSATETGS
jgi:hypothetical protein